MKRNLVLSIAVTIFMVATTVAQAADVTFSGQFRPRFIIDENTNDASTDAATFDTRVRLNANAKVNANTSVFVQLQSVGTWGTCTTGGTITHPSDDGTDNSTEAICGTGTRVSQGGGTGGGNAAQASDQLRDVGFHQAYVTLKNFAGQNFDAKIGRQEVVLDGHRLFGHTGWTTGGETKDAIRLTHSGGNHTINAIYVAGRNGQSIASNADQDENQYILHANTAGVMGGSLSGYFVTTVDGTDDAMPHANTWHTVGARQKGKLGALDYRVEYYHQFGDGAAAANNITGFPAAVVDTSDIDRNAHMFGIRLGTTLKNSPMKPSITLWYDRLSGSDDDDITGNDYGTFDTLSDTGHKFYGFMDFFLHSQNGGTRGLGLQDAAIKTKLSPAAGWTLKTDFHWFSTAVDGSGGDADTFIANDTVLGGSMKSELGTELDVTLVHKYDSNTKVVAGYSHFWTTGTFSKVQATTAAAKDDANDGADWMYVMIDTKF